MSADATYVPDRNPAGLRTTVLSASDADRMIWFAIRPGDVRGFLFYVPDRTSSRSYASREIARGRDGLGEGAILPLDPGRWAQQTVLATTHC